MEEIDLSNPELSEIIKIPGNEICADCEEKNPRWSSINNGVLICSKCTRNHRKYGEKISKIKSLEVDEWNDDEIKILKIGGNYRFNNLINEYNIPLTKENQEYKYYTKIAEYYRNSLKEEVKGNTILFNRPSLKDGIKKIDIEENKNINGNTNLKEDNNNKFDNINNINNNEINYNYNINNQKQNNNQFVNPFINTFGQNHQKVLNNNNLAQKNTLSNFPQQSNNININNNNYNSQQNNYMNNTNNLGNGLNQETFSNNWNSFVYSMGSFFNNVGKKISNTMKEYEIDKRLNLTANYLANKTEEVTNSEIFKSFAQTAEEGFNTIKRKANEIMDNNNSYYNINDDVIVQERKSEIKLDNLNNNNIQNNINENIQNPIKFNIEEHESNNNENKKTINQPKINENNQNIYYNPINNIQNDNNKNVISQNDNLNNNQNNSNNENEYKPSNNNEKIEEIALDI